MNLEHPAAFDPFLDQPVKVHAERRIGGVVQVFDFDMNADVRPGASPGAASIGQARFVGDMFTVTFKSQDWQGDGKPDVGDTFTHEIYGVMYSQGVQRDGLFWQVSCVARQAAGK